MADEEAVRGASPSEAGRRRRTVVKAAVDATAWGTDHEDQGGVVPRAERVLRYGLEGSQGRRRFRRENAPCAGAGHPRRTAGRLIRSISLPEARSIGRIRCRQLSTLMVRRRAGDGVERSPTETKNREELSPDGVLPGSAASARHRFGSARAPALRVAHGTRLARLRARREHAGAGVHPGLRRSAARSAAMRRSCPAATRPPARRSGPAGGPSDQTPRAGLAPGSRPWAGPRGRATSLLPSASGPSP